MFNIFKRKNTNTEKPIFIAYNSYELFNIIIEKIKPFIKSYSKVDIKFEFMNYDYLNAYNGFVDDPCTNNENISKDTSKSELDKLALSIINYWNYGDNAEYLCNELCKSCNKMNLYNVKMSFSFTNYSTFFEASALNIHWKLY